MTASTHLHIPAGTAGDGEDPLLITPRRAGWELCGLRVVTLTAGAERRLETGADEYAVLPLAGACRIEVDGEQLVLDGRPSPFERVSDFAYLPREAVATIRSDAGAHLALPFAAARCRLPAVRIAAEEVAIEVRGAGAATRQLNNFLGPEVPVADRLVCVEVLTPAGNTSSYPPHKHDEQRTGEAQLEEIYYYEVGGTHGAGLHRTYTADGAIDDAAEVRSGDAFLVPRGYHGPCVALPGYDLYYLNVLAGPAAERSLAFTDDPDHAWIRTSWAAQEPDPRVPLCGPGGPTAARELA